MNTDITNLGLDAVLLFEVVARLKSLKLAAQELSLSQPAVTHALNKLEDKLDTQLCIRSRTQFTLTEPGKRLFTVSSNIRSELKNYQGFLRNNEAFDGFFNFYVLDNFKSDVIDLALKNSIKKFPKMKLNIQVQSAGEIQKSVLNGEADIGFGIFHNKLEPLNYQIVGQEKLYYYISSNHELWKKNNINKQNLKGHKVAWVDTIFRNRSDLESLIFVDKENQKMKIQSYTNNLNCALSILKTGGFVVPLPMGFLESQKVNFKYKILKNIKPITLSQSLVYRPNNTKASKVAKYFLSEVSNLLNG